MASHIFALGLIHATRAFLGLALGIFLIVRSAAIPPQWVSRLEPGDRTAFLALGIACLLLASARAVLGASTLVLTWPGARKGRRWPGARRRTIRRLGAVVAVIDLLDITAFPITTACGAYGLIVYRHPESLEFFEGAYSSRPAAPASTRSQGAGAAA